MTDDFARMMEMDNVRPLGQRADPAPNRARTVPPVRPHTPATNAPVAAIPVAAPVYAWATGAKAREVLENGLARLSAERTNAPGWITGVRQDGTSVALSPREGAASLLVGADRRGLRLIVVGGDGWTMVLHPAMGACTLDRDPKGEPA